MGLSASQARLLSITQRLSDNELHSEILANSKMRLADESIEAKNKYIDALDSTKLQYVGFDGYGNADNVDLTFNSLMLYSEIKNQNILRNSNNQVLISETDLYNYENSDDMYEFVCKSCGLNYSSYASQLAAYSTYLADMENYAIQYGDYYEQYVQYMADYEEYLNTPNVYDAFFSVVKDEHGNNISCYHWAYDTNSATCYKHVLMYLLYPLPVTGTCTTEPLTTSIGVNVAPTLGDWNSSALHGDFANANENKLLPVYQAMLDENRYKCDGDDSNAFASTGVSANYNILEAAISSGNTPTAAEILLSDYVYTAPDASHPYGSTTGELKSLRQKAIDMLLLIKDFENNGTSSVYGVTDAQFHNLLYNFTDGDMKKLDWDRTPPTPPTPPTPVDPPLMDFEDKPLVQWYINLWHAIDGQDDPSELRALYNEDGSFKSYTTENKFKQTKYDSSGNVLNPAYEVIPDELKNDANWLQKALANGIISINQITTDSNANKLVWSGIEYTSTTSFNEVADDKKVAKAEAEYQTEMKRIEMEDNKLDMKMKKLDTEHSALKTEYESISQLIGKNIERSYNTFNA